MGDQSPSAEELAAAARGLGLDVRVLSEGDDAITLARESTGPIGMADSGELHAYVIEAVSRLALLGLLGRAAAGS